MEYQGEFRHVRRASRLTLICLLSLGLLSEFAAGEGPALAPEDFAILPWGGTPGDKSVLDEIKACGFNLAGFVAPEGVEAVGAAGLKCIVSDPRIHVGDDLASLDEVEVRKRVLAATEKLRDHPAVYGFYLRDEPSVPLFPALGRFAAAVREAAPNKRTYINLFPIYVNAGQVGAKDYEDYVESFITRVKPSFVSYDNYSLMDDGSLRDGYYENLEVVRKLSLKHNLPFWNIVLGNAHFHYAEPTEGGLRFQAYSSLAYGVRGLSYFTYFTPAIGNYRLGAIDQFGHKTPTWDMLLRVNLQIQRLGPTYIKLKSVNVFHYPYGPASAAKLDSSRYLSAISGSTFVVGEFEGPKGEPFVLIVNKDLRRSTPFDVKFKDGGTIHVVSAYSGGMEPWAGENTWLAPGQGMLLMLKK